MFWRIFFIFEKYRNIAACKDVNHGLEKVRIRSYSGPHFLRIFSYSDSIRISPYSVLMQENPGKMRTRITPNADSFYAVNIIKSCWMSQPREAYLRLSQNLRWDFLWTKVNGSQPLTFVTKISILDPAVVLDTPLTSVRGSFPKSQWADIGRTEDVHSTFLLPFEHAIMFNLGDMQRRI